MGSDQAKGQRQLGLPALYVAIFLLALTGLFAKLIPLDATSIIQLRGVVAASALALFALLQKNSLRLSSRRCYLGVYALGVLLGIHWVTFFHAMQVSTVAVGMLAMFSFPIITIILEPLFTKQGWKISDLIAVLVTLAGLSVMLLQGQTDPGVSISSGVLWGVLSALLFALRNLFQKYSFPQYRSDSLMFHQVVAVGLVLLPFIDYPRVLNMEGAGFLKIVLLGIFSTAGAHTLLVYSLKQIPAKSVALISCLQPVIAAILAWLVVHETPGPMIILGGLTVLSVAVYESVPQRYKGRS
jgi:drug/metabolite transporter (DMT)-like permease